MAARLICPQALINRSFSGDMIGSMFMKRLPQANIFCLTDTHTHTHTIIMKLIHLVAQTVKASAYNVGDPGSIPGLGRSPGEGNGNLLQCSCLNNPMDGGAWQATVHGVAKSWTRLSNFTSLQYICRLLQ